MYVSVKQVLVTLEKMCGEVYCSNFLCNDYSNLSEERNESVFDKSAFSCQY